jgi:hypothetical protein
MAGSQVTWAQSSSPTTAQLPPAWNDAVARLASRIGSLAGSEKTISLTVKNISSLTDRDTAAVSQVLNAELTRLGFYLSNESSPETQAVVTLSECEQGYLWVAQVRRGTTDQTEMVSAPKSERVTEAEANASIVLERTLLWQQPGKFLDFAVFINPVGAYSTLVILEPSRLIFYRSDNLSDWRPGQTVSIPRPTPWPRDLVGGIDQQSGNAYLGPASRFVPRPNVRCTGGFDHPEQIQCSNWSDNRIITVVGPKIPGHENSEGVLLWDRCGDKSVVLATGNGDFTQPDTIQGYFVSSLNGVAVASGAAIDLDGPVMALGRGGTQNAARAVVYNLKTGNYEGYIVTATCGN